jgi:hypothetical protein
VVRASASKYTNTVHVIHGGEKGDTGIIKSNNSTFNNYILLENFIRELQNQTKNNKLENIIKIGTHEDLGDPERGMDSESISRYIKNECQANVILLMISIDLIAYTNTF